MKLQEIQFPHKIRILQVFRNIHVYDKTTKSFDERREFNIWKKIDSASGYVKDGILYLPEQILQNPAFGNCNILTLEDDNSQIDPRAANHNLNGKKNQCFQQANSVSLHIFTLNLSEALALHLNYDYFTIGTPERDHFKICDLQPGKAVEIKINGKTDASLSSRRERVFKEQQYVLEYLGEFDSCLILKQSNDRILKSVPEERKIVDLLKPLW